MHSTQVVIWRFFETFGDQTSSDSAMMTGYALTTQSAIKTALSPAKKLPHGGTRRADGAVGDGSIAAPNLKISRDMVVILSR